MVAPQSMSYIKSAGKLRKVLDEFLDHFITVAFIFMTVIILVGVFSRFLPFVIYWSEIAARFANTWVTFVGSAILVQKGQHIRVNYFDALLDKKRLFHPFAFISNFLTLIVCTLIMYGGYLQLQATWHEYVTVWPGVRFYFLWLAPFLGLGFLNFYLILNLIAIAIAFFSGRREDTAQGRPDEE